MRDRVYNVSVFTDLVDIFPYTSAGNFQLIADVFESKTYTIQHTGFAAPLGCAISGARAFLNISYEEAASRFVQLDGASFKGPLEENRRAIKTLLQRYKTLEKDTATQLQL